MANYYWLFPVCSTTAYAITLIVLLAIYGKTQVEHGFSELSSKSRNEIAGITLVPAVCDLLVCIGVISHYVGLYVQKVELEMKEAEGLDKPLVAEPIVAEPIVAEPTPSSSQSKDAIQPANRPSNPISAYIFVVLVSAFCTLVITICKENLLDITSPLYVIIMIHICIYLLLIAGSTVCLLCCLLFGIWNCMCCTRKMIVFKCCKRNPNTHAPLLNIV